MKTALFLLLFCLAGADDIRWDFQQFKRQLEGQYADLASRLSTSETKIAELVAELHKHKADQLQSGLDQFQDSLNLVTKEQDCLRRKLCEQDGFTYGAGLCYYISTEKKNWEESRQWCRDRQSDLMVIKETEKQDLVASFNKRIWLGLSDSQLEGSFQWVDGTPLTTPMYWMPGEPEDSTYPNAEEDCVEYYDGSQSDDPNRGWNDAPCSIHIAYWMCERVPC